MLFFGLFWRVGDLGLTTACRIVDFKCGRVYLYMGFPFRKTARVRGGGGPVGRGRNTLRGLSEIAGTAQGCA